MQYMNCNTIISVVAGDPVSIKTCTYACRPSQDQSCCHLEKKLPVVATQSKFLPRENRILALLIKMPVARSSSNSAHHGNASVRSGKK